MHTLAPHQLRADMSCWPGPWEMQNAGWISTLSLISSTFYCCGHICSLHASAAGQWHIHKGDQEPWASFHSRKVFFFYEFMYGSHGHFMWCIINYYSFSRLLKHYTGFWTKFSKPWRHFSKSTPILLNYKHYSPALTHESDLVNCHCNTLHTNPYISQCLHHVVI